MRRSSCPQARSPGPSSIYLSINQSIYTYIYIYCFAASCISGKGGAGRRRNCIYTTSLVQSLPRGEHDAFQFLNTYSLSVSFRSSLEERREKERERVSKKPSQSSHTPLRIKRYSRISSPCALLTAYSMHTCRLQHLRFASCVVCILIQFKCLHNSQHLCSVV